MERGRFPIKFTLLWAANLAVLTVVYILCDIRLPIFINSRDMAGVLSGLALVLALLESALVSKLKGE